MVIGAFVATQFVEQDDTANLRVLFLTRHSHLLNALRAIELRLPHRLRRTVCSAGDGIDITISRYFGGLNAI